MSRLSTAILTLATTLALADVGAAQTGRPVGIRWHHDHVAAQSQARERGLPIVAFVVSEHCGYCRKMDRETWSDPNVVSAVQERFVPLRIEADRNPGLVKHLRVRVFPTTIVFGPDGRVLHQARGFLPPNELREVLSGSGR